MLAGYQGETRQVLFSRMGVLHVRLESASPYDDRARHGMYRRGGDDSRLRLR